MVSARPKNTPEILMSSGGGRLHFIEAMTALLELHVDVSLIVGVKPPTWGRGFINFVGLFFGKRDVYRRIAARLAGGKLPEERLLRCTLAELNIHVLYRLADFGLVPRGGTQGWAWRVFGWASARHLKPGGRIFHVRSGAGQGGAIAKARKLGYRIVVDHSIAHPRYISEVLAPIRGLHVCRDFEDFTTAFWAVVLADCREADVLLVNSEFVRETFIKNGFAPAKIQVIYWGVRSDFVGCKSSYAMGPTVRLLFTGAFTLRKGAHVVMAALADLDRRGIAYELTIAGGAHVGPQLQKSYGVAGPVRYLGNVPQEELRSLFIESDIYIFPSLAEGSARSAMEAMGSGLPVIVTANTGLPLTHGEDGLLVPVGDAQTLADAIVRLVSDGQLREKLGRVAAANIGRNYTWSRYAQNLCSLYQSAE